MDVATRNKLLIFLLSGFFLFWLLYCLSQEKYLIFAVPLFLSIIFITIFNIKYLFYSIVILTPLSISLSDSGFEFSDINIAIPTEPLLFGFMILTLFKISYHSNLFKKILQHRIAFFLLLYLFWMLITCVTSSMPLVSLKMWLSRCWYILPIFFIGSMLFQDRDNIYYFIASYIIPLSIVVIYTTVRHAGYSFDKESAHYMMSPFFNDHTSYGAMIAFFLPFSIACFWVKKNNTLFRLLFLMIIIVLIIGLIFSFTRAACRKRL